MNNGMRQELGTTPTIIGQSPAALRMRDFGERISATKHPVLLLGQTGTGKDQLAEFIHHCRHGAQPQMITVDCGILTESLAESELFGHMPGAFTGAIGTRVGLVEAAGEGTLFFNEVANMSLAVQAKLLRIMDKKPFRKLGSTRDIPVTARVIAATHANLHEAVKRGEFREDLFHRLDGIHFTVPPLRERREDIPMLADHFLAKQGFEKTWSQGAVDTLCEYEWPGNIRELSKVVLRAGFFSGDDQEIKIRDLHFSRNEEKHAEDPLAIAVPVPGVLKPKGKSLIWGEQLPTMEEVRKAYFIEVLIRTRGDLPKAARVMGVARKTAWNNVEMYNLWEFCKAQRE
jgi:two-component system response regulator AtoC